MGRKRRQTLAASVAAVIVVALIAFVFHSFTSGKGATIGRTTGGTSDTAKQQLFAQQGGIRVEAAATCPLTAPSCDLARAIPAAVSVLNRRLADAGIANALVRQSGADGLLIEAPGLTDEAKLRALLVPGAVTFLDTDAAYVAAGTDVSARLCATACQPGQYAIVFTAAQLDPASVQVSVDPQTNQTAVTFAFGGDARTRFATYTQQHIGQYLTIALDGTIIESATIQSAIPDTGQITGIGSPQQAQKLARFLKDGALPVTLATPSLQHVSPTT